MASYFKQKVFLLPIVMATFIVHVAYAHAQERKPLLQEGKKTLFQRVISHPGAKLYAQPDGNSQVLQSAVKPFTVFYVYTNAKDWLEVGTSSTEAMGWLQIDKTSKWKQALTLLFTDRTGRMPVLFFKDQNAIVNTCSSQHLGQDLDRLMKSIDAAKKDASTADLPVLAMEPNDQEGSVSSRRFYLMPIMQMLEPFEGTKLLQVASIDPGSAPAKNIDPLRTGIAFVIDTTISMGPYIKQSLEVVRSVYDSIQQSKNSDKVAFAMVAFRSSTKASPGLEYVTKVVSDFCDVNKRKSFESKLAQVTEAKVSSHSFDEDAMAGVKTAIEKLNWAPYTSRIIILISDAGPLQSHDTYATARMAVDDMADLARSNHIYLVPVHIKSPSGGKDHAYAADSYKRLSRLPDNTDSYLALNAKNTDEGIKAFSAATRKLADGMVTLAQSTAEGRFIEKPLQHEAQTDAGKRAEDISHVLGYAMQLDYIGQKRGNQAPSVLSSWIADMDLKQLSAGRSVPAVEVAVLLTKNQLSDLQKQIKIIIDQAERTKKTDSKDFFQGILSASAQMARDPARFSKAPGQNLQQTGVLGEFLEGLPYKSDIMLLREEDWYRMSVGEQTAFINRLKSRIVRYEEYDKDQSNWESFGAPNAGDWMYRVPLNMLP